MILISSISNVYAEPHTFPEYRYRDAWCNKMEGKTEYRLDDGTSVDCVTNDYAIEVEFAPKHYEAIGQALFYALKTGKQAGIVVILENGNDGRYMDRLYLVAKSERIKIWAIVPADLWK